MCKYFAQDEEAEWVKQTGHRGWSYQMMRLISESRFGGGQFSEAHEAARRGVDAVDRIATDWQRRRIHAPFLNLGKISRSPWG